MSRTNKKILFYVFEDVFHRFAMHCITPPATAVYISVDRFLQNTTPIYCLPCDRIGVWHPGIGVSTGSSLDFKSCFLIRFLLIRTWDNTIMMGQGSNLQPTDPADLVLGYVVCSHGWTVPFKNFHFITQSLFMDVRTRPIMRRNRQECEQRPVIKLEIWYQIQR
jgi:hypothetical protein